MIAEPKKNTFASNEDMLVDGFFYFELNPIIRLTPLLRYQAVIIVVTETPFFVISLRRVAIYLLRIARIAVQFVLKSNSWIKGTILTKLNTAEVIVKGPCAENSLTALASSLESISWVPAGNLLQFGYSCKIYFCKAIFSQRTNRRQSL
jgi:hypothetical protein